MLIIIILVYRFIDLSLFQSPCVKSIAVFTVSQFVVYSVALSLWLN